MLIAILVTNTDESEFAQNHLKDGEKFSTLLLEKRPDWEFEVFSVKDDIFPEDTDRFDGLLITGSPASVHDGLPWILRLQDLIRKAHASKKPLYGACFGHQIIATALGGEVKPNPGGWVLGLVNTTMTNLSPPQTLKLYAAHKEQVVKAPKGAGLIATTPGCPIAGFAIEDHIQTTQYHPEMTHEFIKALVEEMAKELDPTVIEVAKKSLNACADRQVIAETIATFFEFAKQKRR